MNLRGLVFFGLFLAALAVPSARAGERDRALRRVILCARDVAQQAPGRFPNRFLAVDYLNRAREGAGRVEALKALGSECRSMAADLSSGELEKKDPALVGLQKRYYDWLVASDFRSFPGVPAAVSELALDFEAALSPDSRLHCAIVGPEVMLGLGLAVTADAEGGFCRRSDGRRWAVLGAGFGAGVGGGAAVGLHFGPTNFDDLADLRAGIFAGFYPGIGLSVNMAQGLENTEEVSIGVGVAAYTVLRLSALGRVVPLPTDARWLARRLLVDASPEGPALQ